MHKIEYLTRRSGWVIFMSRTKTGVLLPFMRFISSDSLAIVDEPDKTIYPRCPDTNSYNKLKGQRAAKVDSTVEGQRGG